jgi:Family of unknown function (DUF6636)
MRKLALLAALVAALAVAGPASAATSFHSPSGNIRCVIDGTSFTRCDITNRDWSPPPKPQSCKFDWGNSLGLGFRGPARFLCVSDAVDSGRTLDYGKSIKRGRFRCRSRMSGMRCVNVRNGHGFAVSKQRVRRF